MAGIRIISNSTSDIPKDIRDKYGIYTLPLCIVLNDKSYYDREEITTKEIVEWAETNKTTPKTAAATFDRATELITKCKEADEDVIFFGISEDLSTTCNVVRLTANDLDYSDRVFVVDTKNLCLGEALLVLKAIDLIEEGKSAKEIVEILEVERDKVVSKFIPSELTFLARGGRCSASTALLGNMLQIKPVIKVEDGKMDVDKKYRGKAGKVMLTFLKDIEEDLKNADPKRVAIARAMLDDATFDAIVDYVKSLNVFEEIIINEAGGVIMSHCGPGTFGIFYNKK